VVAVQSAWALLDALGSQEIRSALDDAVKSRTSTDVPTSPPPKDDLDTS
jgi:hypothetical protein